MPSAEDLHLLTAVDPRCTGMVSEWDFKKVLYLEGGVGVLFCRYTNQISDNNWSSYNVHTRVVVVIMCELD